MRKLISISLLFFLSLTVLSQGTELLTDGDFSDGTTYWGVTNGITISGGVASVPALTYCTLYQTDGNMVESIKASTTYTISFDISSPDNYARFRINDTNADATYVSHSLYDENKTYQFEFTTPSDIGYKGLEFYVWNTSHAFTIDNISLKENFAIGDSPYYVAADGDDMQSGDIDHPWATWGKAGRVAQPGDTVYFRGGVYNMTETISLDADADELNNGTDGNLVCFFGYPNDLALGDSVIFDFSGNTIVEPNVEYLDSIWFADTTFVGTGNTGISLSWWSYFHLKDFTIRNVYQKYQYVLGHGLFFLGCTNFIVETLYIHHIGGEGFFSSPDLVSDTSLIKNVDVYNCIDSLSVNPKNYYEGKAGTRSHGFFIIVDSYDTINLANHSTVTIEGCRAWKCGDDGFNVVVLGEVVMRNNWSFANGAYLPHMPSPYSSGNGYKLNAQAGDHNDYAKHTWVQYGIYNNIAAFNNGYGFSDNCDSSHPRKNRSMYNNTSYYNGYGYIIKAGSLTRGYWYEDYINNIAYRNNYNLNEGGEANITTNLTNSWTTPPGATVSDGDFVLLNEATAIAQLAGARKADGSLPDITFGTLAASSDLINVGTDVGIAYNSTAPDLGAFEFNPNDYKYAKTLTNKIYKNSSNKIMVLRK